MNSSMGYARERHFSEGPSTKGGGVGWGEVGCMFNNMAPRTKNCRPSPRWSIPAHRAPVYGFVKSFPSRNNPIKREKKTSFQKLDTISISW